MLLLNSHSDGIKVLESRTLEESFLFHLHLMHGFRLKRNMIKEIGKIFLFLLKKKICENTLNVIEVERIDIKTYRLSITIISKSVSYTLLKNVER